MKITQRYLCKHKHLSKYSVLSYNVGYLDVPYFQATQPMAIAHNEGIKIPFSMPCQVFPIFKLLRLTH